MRFAEPNFLWCLFTLPLFALLFYYAYRRRKKLAARFVSLSMLPKLSTSVSPWRRLAKVTLLLLALAFLFVAVTSAFVVRPLRRGTELMFSQRHRKGRVKLSEEELEEARALEALESRDGAGAKSSVES